MPCHISHMVERSGNIGTAWETRSIGLLPTTMGLGSFSPSCRQPLWVTASWRGQMPFAWLLYAKQEPSWQRFTISVLLLVTYFCLSFFLKCRTTTAEWQWRLRHDSLYNGCRKTRDENGLAAATLGFFLPASRSTISADNRQKKTTRQLPVSTPLGGRKAQQWSSQSYESDTIAGQVPMTYLHVVPAGQLRILLRPKISANGGENPLKNPSRQRTNTRASTWIGEHGVVSKWIATPWEGVFPISWWLSPFFSGGTGETYGFIRRMSVIGTYSRSLASKILYDVEAFCEQVEKRKSGRCKRMGNLPIVSMTTPSYYETKLTLYKLQTTLSLQVSLSQSIGLTRGFAGPSEHRDATG